jgi:hypothetical protein
MFDGLAEALMEPVREGHRILLEVQKIRDEFIKMRSDYIHSLNEVRERIADDSQFKSGIKTGEERCDYCKMKGREECDQ